MAQSSTRGVVFFGTCFGIVPALLLLAGCSGSGQGFRSSTTTRNVLLGTWTRSSLTSDGTTVSCPNTLAVNAITLDSCVANETIQFNSDNTYVISDPATKFGAVYTESGTYTLNGSTLTLTRLQTDILNGVVTPGTSVNLPSAVVVPNAITFSVTNGFTLQPAVPTSGAGYTVPVAADGTTIISTYTKS